MKYIVSVNSKRYEVEIEKAGATYATPAAQPVMQPVAQPVMQPAPQPVAQPAQASGGAEVRSAMPGSVWEVKCAVGQSVNEGDVLIILEAMKMEIEIISTASGVVNQILVSKGAAVESGDVLVVLR